MARRSSSSEFLARRAGAVAVSPWRSRLPSLQLKIAVLAGRAQHAQRYHQDLEAIQNDATALRAELETMHAELSPFAGSDPSGQVRDVLLAADALIARLHVIAREGTILRPLRDHDGEQAARSFPKPTS